MNQTTFDPDAFMQQQVGDAMSTAVRLIPEKEYQAMVGDFTKDAFEQIDFTYKKGKRAGQEGSMTKFVPAARRRSASASNCGRLNTAPKCRTGTPWPSTALVAAAPHSPGARCATIWWP